MSGVVARRTQMTAVVDVIAVCAVAIGLAILAGRVWTGVRTAADGIAVTVMLAAGYVMADLLTGFVHWFCDTFFEEDTPIIGPALIASFREHHRDPLLMTRHSFLELTGSSFRGLAPILAWLVWAGDGIQPGWSALALSLSAGAVLTNFLHRWAHEPQPPAVARILQRLGVILTPARHTRHHAPPYAAAYCVTTGWLNPLCERLRIWQRAEALLAAAGVPISRDHGPAKATPSAG